MNEITCVRCKNTKSISDYPRSTYNTCSVCIKELKKERKEIVAKSNLGKEFTCTKCKESGIMGTDFTLNNQTATGYSNFCKHCISLSRKSKIVKPNNFNITN